MSEPAGNYSRLAAGWVTPLLMVATILAGDYSAFVSKVQSFELSNGLTLLIYPDPTVRRVVCQLFIKVGSRQEFPGVTGVSHLIEHLYMPGKRAADREGDDLTAVGGSTGAHTYADYTDVLITVPDRNAELAIRMLANRFQDLNATEERVATEKKIVWNERLLKENGPPTWMLREQLWALGLSAHPYRNPVAGWPSDILSISAEQVNRFFSTYYVPRNAVLVVVGNIEPGQVHDWVRKYWGPIPDRRLPDLRVTEEPAQQGPRRSLVRRPATGTAVAVAYHIPPFNHPDRAALLGLSKILEDPEGPLFQAFIKDARLFGVDQHLFQVSANLDPTLVTLIVELSDKTDPAAAEEKLYQVLEDLGRKPTSEHLLEKARNGLEMDFYSFIIHPPWTMYSLGSKAYQLGHYQVLSGDYRVLENEVERYRALTSDRFMEAARKYFSPERRSTVLLIPEASSD